MAAQVPPVFGVFFRYPACGFLSFVGMSWQFGASTDFLFVEIFGHLTFCFSRLCFLRSGPFRDIRRLDFVFLLSIFPDDLCTANWGKVERNFSLLDL